MATPDLFVIGGALGTKWGGPVGWSAFIHAPATQTTHKIVDGAAVATQDEADVMPFAAAIQWWHRVHNPNFEIPTPSVICLTDSPDLVAAAADPELRVAPDWRFIHWFEIRGYDLTWKWESRSEHLSIIGEAEIARAAFTSALRRAEASSRRQIPKRLGIPG